MASSLTLKKILIIGHRWLALILAPLFLALTLSGAVLALKPVVEDLSSPPANTVTLSQVVSVLGQVDPRGQARAAFVSDGQVVVSSNGGDVAYDPATATPSTRQPGFDVFAVAKSFHKNLLLGLGWLVEIATYAMAAVLVAGPFLAWPRLRNTVMGWHMGLGWVLFPLALLTPVTAILMILGVGLPQIPGFTRGQQSLSLVRALEVVAPGVDPNSLTMVRKFKGGTVMIGLSDAPALVVSAKGEISPMPDVGWVKPVHEGTWGGTWSGLLNFAAALLLTGLMGTGLWSWWRRARLNRPARSQAMSADAVMVLFASQTGTAARVADGIAKALRAGGRAAESVSLAGVTPAQLEGRLSLLVVSTTGEGDVPDAARPFLERIADADLGGSRFALLALGDRRYAHFCGGGATVREALFAKGAREVLPWRQVDGEPGAVADEWLADLGMTISGSAAVEADVPVVLTLVGRRRLDDPQATDTNESWSLDLEAEAAHAFRPGDLLMVSAVPGHAERCYSIGSTNGTRITLTVGVARWVDAHGREHLGEASGYLCREIPLGTRINARLRRHHGFNPPEDASRPLVMVATGCGIAPFPGFIEERAAQVQRGPAWLIFGNRRETGDFLYGERLREWVANGVLTRLDTAFSRDPNGAYVQQRLVENGARLARYLLDDGGVLYVCGRASTIGQSIFVTLVDILIHDRAFDADQARRQVDLWRQNGTVRLDLFG